MTDPNLTDPTDKQTPSTPTRPKKPLWRRLIRWICLSVIIVMVLLAAVVTIGLWYLTPERLTPLVNRYASEYLNAEVRASRVELTFWSTFPRFDIAVDSLDIVSRSLDGLPEMERDKLPADADSLLSLERFSGGIHVMKILTGDVELYDIELTNPRVNLVVANDSINNFNIVPPSEESSEPSAMKISFNRFALNGSMPVRYHAPADSIDFTLTLDRTELSNETSPLYDIALSGNTGARISSLNIPKVPFSINGKLTLDINDPRQIELSGFTLALLGFRAEFNAKINMSDDLLVDHFDIRLPQVEVARLLGLLPEKMTGPLSKIDTDLTIDLALRMLEPYRPASSSGLPRVQTDIEAKASRLNFGQMHLTDIDMSASAMIDPDDPDRSTIDIEQLKVIGKAMGFKVSARISQPISDPYVEGNFSGGLSFDRLPAQLLQKLPATIHGLLRGDADFRLRMSQLTPKQFHRVKIDGELSLTDFSAAMNDGTADTYIHSATFNLGTNSRRQYGDDLVDSMLTASLNIDTISFRMPGLQLAGRGLSANVGSKNVGSSSDTTQINPIGGSIRAGLITLNADSANTRIRLREAVVGGSLRRYNSDARSPQLDLLVQARRMSLRDSLMRASVNNARATLRLNPRTRHQVSPRLQARIDSLAAIHPELSTDSLTTLARKSLRRTRSHNAGMDERENIDFGVDNSLASWLRLWQLSGTLSADRARCYTPLYPARTSLTHLDMSFSTDSVILRDTRLETGKSDFTINGSIHNISRALTSRVGSPIDIRFDVESDTIDINDLTATLIRGAAYSEGLTPEGMATDDDDNDNIDLPETADDTEVAAVVIPSNINAELRMKARHIHYGDMWLDNFDGDVNIYDGALSLDRLQAFTDMGSMQLTALYSAPTRHDISFAAGMNIAKLNLHKVLGMMPEIDSIMPMLNSVEGIVDAKLALTTDLDSLMNIRFETLDMALQLSGDSLVLLDSETFRTVAKWMLFKNKQRNMIDHMDVEVMIHNGWLDLYPVVFDMDRYRLGIVGNNDMNLNLDYHVAVLKSPLPFKFGINIKGTPDDMKIRLGKARLNEKSVASQRLLTDSIRVNLLSEIRRTFRRGVRKAGTTGLKMQRAAHASAAGDDDLDTLSAADSAAFIREGLIEAPEGYIDPENAPADGSSKPVGNPAKPDSNATIPSSKKKR